MNADTTKPAPLGYKRTEVGVIPTDWDVTRIGSQFNVKAGGDFDPTNSNEVQGDNYPYPIYANSLSQQGDPGAEIDTEAQWQAAKQGRHFARQFG